MGNSGMKLQLRLAILLGSILRRWGGTSAILS